MFSKVFILIFTMIAFGQASCVLAAESPTPEEARAIAKEAYIYGFPMVVNYKTMYNYTLNESSPEYKAPFNQMNCEARLYTPDDKAIVTPNSDTPYCMFWADLRDEPQVIELPEMEAERFYHFQLIDLYTHNFAYLGTLSTGNKAGKYLLAKQGWNGEKPKGIDEVIFCETDLFFVIVRTQLMNDADLANVEKIQDSFQLKSLNEYNGNKAVRTERTDDYPVWKDGDEFTAESFKYLDLMLHLAPIVNFEIELRKKISRLGLGTKGGFDINRFDEDIQKAIEEGVKEGFKEMQDFVEQHATDPLISSKIFGTREFLSKSAKENYNLDSFYLLRAIAAERGVYGNSGDEAIYPTYLMEAPGVPFNAAEHNYKLTFKKGELPPVKAFWSLSMYDGISQLFIHNPLNRYLLNSGMMNDFVYEDDGSLTLYLQKDSPGAALESNWLPAPDGPFYTVLRLYGPKQNALSGNWVNPPLVENN